MEHSISFSYHGRYFSLGDTTDPKQVWFVLHGYGQLAAFFVQRFSVLKEHNIRVIAPEALSRFYQHETEDRMRTGDMRVGASWMTREDRLTDIRNYIEFLNAVYQKEAPQKNVPVTVLGFSQGAATATRWVLDGKVDFKRLILWAGILPPDIDFSAGKEILHSKEFLMVYGDKDPFLNDSRFAEMKMLSEKLGVTPKQLVFEGGHTIEAKLLLDLA
jgi:predicted esterase